MLIPSRGRPAAAAHAVDSAMSMARDTGTRVLVAVDADDPELGNYERAIPEGCLRIGHPRRIGPLLNEIVAEQLDAGWSHYGFMGDDHRCRTSHWDEQLMQPGVAYGNDLVHGEGLPTAFVVNARVIRELGYIVPPGILHLYFDNAALVIGERYGLVYWPNVIIEHLHPLVGKAEWDEGYERANSAATNDHDREVYEAWRKEFASDRRPAV